MKPEQREVLLRLLIVGADYAPVNSQEILDAFETNDGVTLATRLLNEATLSHSAEDLELALFVAGTFKATETFVDTLIELFPEDWHHCHENIVFSLDGARQPRAVPTFLLATTWVPEYLDFDESRALARKAIHALGNIPTEETTQALEELAQHEDPTLAGVAQRQLERRRTEA